MPNGHRFIVMKQQYANGALMSVKMLYKESAIRNALKQCSEDMGVLMKETPPYRTVNKL